MSEILHLLIDRIPTPIGEMVIIADRDGNLRAVDWTDRDPRAEDSLRLHTGPQNGKAGFTLTPAPNPSGLSQAIRNYFAGDLTAIDSLPTKTNGAPFQREVWQALREIPVGTTTSYGELAKHIGRPKAVRAVGLANGSNPVSVIVPVTVSSAPTARSPATAEDSTANAGSSTMSKLMSQSQRRRCSSMR